MKLFSKDALGVLAIVVCTMFFGWLLVDIFKGIQKNLQEIANADALTARQTQTCYDHGYSKRLWTDGRAYCYKLVNGTEVVTPIEQVK